jgi:hypothetical protein
VADGTHAQLLASTPLYSEVLAQAASEEKAEAEGDLEVDLEDDETDPTPGGVL